MVSMDLLKIDEKGLSTIFCLSLNFYRVFKVLKQTTLNANKSNFFTVWHLMLTLPAFQFPCLLFNLSCLLSDQSNLFCAFPDIFLVSYWLNVSLSDFQKWLDFSVIVRQQMLHNLRKDGHKNAKVLKRLRFKLLFLALERLVFILKR
jgi:hypothetical protein